MVNKVHVRAHERDYPKGHKVVVRKTTKTKRGYIKDREDENYDAIDRMRLRNYYGKHHGKSSTMVISDVMSKKDESGKRKKKHIVEYAPTEKYTIRSMGINERQFLKRKR